MKLVAVETARVIGFLEVDGFDPRGRMSLLEGIKILTDRYGFVAAPKTLAELDLHKGIHFGHGRLGDIRIDKLGLYNNGLLVETHSSTTDSKIVIEDFITHVHQALDSEVAVHRWMTVSNIIFTSELDLTKLHGALSLVAEQVSRSVSQDFGRDVRFQPSAFNIGYDPSETDLRPPNFSIERRIDTPYSATTYFSGAPVGTATHIELLERLENALT